ncbi:MAG TPA: hypothetical protein VGD60_00570 [Candidatus Acidoferrales bacterium]
MTGERDNTAEGKVTQADKGTVLVQRTNDGRAMLYVGKKKM